jgi:peptidyl-prolyl cis-trans isomerase-like 1
MDKLKSMFGKHEEGSSSSSTTPQSTSRPAGGAQTGGDPSNAEGVVLHTTLGDITIALFKDQTPKVSFNGLTHSYNHTN